MLNTKEVSELLKVHQNTLYKMIKEGLPSYKIGNTRRYDEKEVLQWIKENK